MALNETPPFKINVLDLQILFSLLIEEIWAWNLAHICWVSDEALVEKNR